MPIRFNIYLWERDQAAGCLPDVTRAGSVLRVAGVQQRLAQSTLFFYSLPDDPCVADARNGASVSEVETNEIVISVTRHWLGGPQSVTLAPLFEDLLAAIKNYANKKYASSKHIDDMFDKGTVNLV